jgi:hypothetical protein
MTYSRHAETDNFDHETITNMLKRIITRCEVVGIWSSTYHCILLLLLLLLLLRRVSSSTQKIANFAFTGRFGAPR